jgi:CII-binding regulator of phage lambda lysogenization HflD
MLDVNVLITILPPILAAVFAYLIARKRNAASERVNRAKIEADVQTQALQIVRGVMNDMRDEFKREIDALHNENKSLREEIEENKSRLMVLQKQLVASDELVETMRSEISALKKTLAVYEAEIERLRKSE